MMHGVQLQSGPSPGMQLAPLSLCFPDGAHVTVVTWGCCLGSRVVLMPSLEVASLYQANWRQTLRCGAASFTPWHYGEVKLISRAVRTFVAQSSNLSVVNDVDLLGNISQYATLARPPSPLPQKHADAGRC